MSPCRVWCLAYAWEILIGNCRCTGPQQLCPCFAGTEARAAYCLGPSSCIPALLGQRPRRPTAWAPAAVPLLCWDRGPGGLLPAWVSERCHSPFVWTPISSTVRICAWLVVNYSSRTRFFAVTSCWRSFPIQVFQVAGPLYLCHPGLVNCLCTVEPLNTTANILRKYFNYILTS